MGRAPKTLNKRFIVKAMKQITHDTYHDFDRSLLRPSKLQHVLRSSILSVLFLLKVPSLQRPV